MPRRPPLAVEHGAVPTVSDEEPLNVGGPFVQRVRLGKLLVEHQLTIGSGDAQHVGRLTGAGVDLVLEPLGATLQDRLHVEGIGPLARHG